MGPKRIRIAWVGSALVLVALLLLIVLGPRMGHRGADGQAHKEPASTASPGPRPAPAGTPASGAEEPSRLADRLNSPAGDVGSDLRIIDGSFIAFRSALR